LHAVTFEVPTIGFVVMKKDSAPPLVTSVNAILGYEPTAVEVAKCTLDRMMVYGVMV
jgi:hypothetical protein